MSVDTSSARFTPLVPPTEPPLHYADMLNQLRKGSEIELDVEADFFPNYINLRTRIRQGRSVLEHVYNLTAEEAEALAWALTYAVGKSRERREGK